MADRRKEGLLMIALVEFDKALTQEQFDGLHKLYDFGKTTTRVCKDYDGKLRPMESCEFYESEVMEVEQDDRVVRVLRSDTTKVVPSYYIQQDIDSGWVGIEKTKHVVDLEELYKTYRTIQIRILEVAKV